MSDLLSVHRSVDLSYSAVMARKGDILRRSLGIDYERFRRLPLGCDYEGLMAVVGHTLEEVRGIQAAAGVGRTPLLELPNVTALARAIAPPGHGARILVKDEAANPSGSFKDRRAALSVYQARRQGYPGVIAATSGNYGAAVASQAARAGLHCLVVQEVYDSRGVGQPEILEKGRKCEALGAEVVQLTVGPELFYVFLRLLEETRFFNASLYTPFSIAGIETVGVEIAEDVQRRFGRKPDAVLVTHAGGGNVTGTARGLRKAGCRRTRVIGVSVDLSGLHMASDRDFNRKSFTTGHTGFGVPFATWPDRADVPFNAARSLRYLDRYVTVTQGEVFYVTEMLAKLEGLERGPAGNTSLAAAVPIAAEMGRDEILVVQETEYTGAGKHPTAQLTLARRMGVEVRRGDPSENVPGRAIVIPEDPSQLHVVDVPLEQLRRSYLKNAARELASQGIEPAAADEATLAFLAEDTNSGEAFVREALGTSGSGARDGD